MRNKIEYFLIDKKIKKDNLVSNIKERIINDEEGAHIIEIIIGSAIFAALALLVLNLIGDAIKSKTSDAANIINDAKLK